jgi:hypothetical protein
LKARGDIEVSLEWKDGKILNATLKSQKDKKVLVESEGRTIEVQLKHNQPLSFNRQDFIK